MKQNNQAKRLIQKALRLQQAGQIQALETLCQRTLTKPGQHPEALQALGVLTHQNGYNDTAVRLLQQAIRINPQDAKAHYNMGNLCKLLGQLDKAKDCYHQAVALQADNAEAHYNLGVILMEQEQCEAAVAEYKQALNIDPHRAEVQYNLGIVLMTLGRDKEARFHLSQTLAMQPDNAEAHGNLGVILQRQGEYAAAREHYQKALVMKPEEAEIHNDLGLVYQCLNQPDEAMNAYQQALTIKPDYAEAHNNLGLVLHELGRPAEAIPHFEQALAIQPDNAEIWVNFGELYEQLSQLDKAQDCLDHALAIQADNPNANKLAAKLLKRAGEYEAALSQLKAISKLKVSARIQYSTQFELGKLYDLLGEYDLAMQHFTEANRIQASTLPALENDENPYLRKVATMTMQLSRKQIKLATKVAEYKEIRKVYFLIGFPRSGTTLLDQILDSHPQIQVIEEQTMIEDIAESLANKSGYDDYPAILGTIGEQEINQLRIQYLKQAEKYLKPQSDLVIIDKLPLNIVHIPLIYKLFPNAKFIFALRHPCDVCLSNFMQQYKINQAMANFFTLEDTVKLYDSVMRLWRLYARLLPIDYHTVKYESLVDNFKAETKTLINFLGLTWEPVVLDHVQHAKNRGQINTPSYSQVTKPIYKQAVYRWRRYEAYLKPFINTLAPHIDYFGYL